MPVHLIFFVILIVVGAIGSVLLVPGANELAYMHFKAQNFDFARRDFEAMVDKGDVSASTVLPLGELYLIQGEMDRAIALIENYVATNPWDVAGLRKLVDFYRFGQKTERQLASLEALVERQPNRENFRELMGLHDLLGRVDDHSRVLDALVRSGQAEPDEYELLAYRQAAASEPDKARATLDTFRRRFPKAFHDALAELSLALALDRGDVSGGFDRARRWVEEFREIRGAVAMAQVLAMRGRADLGLRLLEVVAKEPVRDAELLGTLIDLEFAVGRNRQAHRWLVVWETSGYMPEGRLPLLVGTKLALEGLDAALPLVERTDPELFPDWLVIGLVERAVRDGRTEVAGRLVEKLGRTILDSRPVLAAELAWLQGDRPAYRKWTALALDREDLPIDDKATLARLLAREGRGDIALRLMRDLVAEPATPVALAGDLVQLFVTLGRRTEGLAYFDRLRVERPSPIVDAGWARLATLAGRGEDVRKWLAGATDPDVQLLEDLFFIAGDSKQSALALDAATRLYSMRPTIQVTRHLATALMAAGRPKDALEPLRALLPGDAELRETFVAALEAAGETEELARFRASELAGLAPDDPRRGEIAQMLLGMGAFDEALPALRTLAREQGREWIYAFTEASKTAGKIDDAAAFLRDELARTDLTIEESATRLHALIGLIGPGALLPELRRAAEAWGGDWIGAYVGAAKSEGRIGEAAAFLKAELERPGLSAKERDIRLYALLDTGDIEAALPILKRLAAAEGGEWLFGFVDAAKKLGRTAEAVALLTAEAGRKDLSEADRETRIGALIDVGGPAAALPILRDLASGDRAKWLYSYADTAKVAGEQETLAGDLAAWLDRDGPESPAAEARVALLLERAPERAVAFLETASRKAPDAWMDRLLAVLGELKRKEPLIAALRRDLDRANLPRAKRDRRLYALMDVGGDAEAAPYLGRIARAEGGDWIGAYDAALGKLGRAAERDAFLASLALDARRPVAERRQVAFRLLELGRRGDGVAAFKALAESAGPKSPDVEQLLYLWGPRPEKGDLDWIEAKARRATDGDRGAWMRRLADLGAPERAIAVGEAGGLADGAAFDAYLDALASLRKPERAGLAVEAMVRKTESPERLRRLGRLAEQEGQTAPAASAYRALLSRAPNDATGLLGAGRTALALGKRAEAKGHLQRLAAVGQDDFESTYLLGEVLLAEKKSEDAKAAFRRSLEKAQAAEIRPFTLRLTEALALHRLGRSEDALAALDVLREERPKDTGLRADYAGVLLDLGRKDQAAKLLATH